jgi:multiple sugar transport system substrate-binding protein/raffinose/stachyose/melibiose transport system substrate-binding protein
MKSWRSLAIAALGAAMLTGGTASAEDKVTIMHYFSAEVGGAGLKPIFEKFHKTTGMSVVDSPIGHEDYKTAILVRAAGNGLPDVFSEWAGARAQFVVDTGKLRPLDDLWGKDHLDDIVSKPVAKSATIYNGKHYLVPIGFHYAGFFYNPKVLKQAGIAATPKTWDEFLAMCKTLKAKGITPFALGSKNRWPGQFWFDYLLLRTAGPDYRAKLMAGKASYTDPQVKKAMELWKGLVDAGDFTPNPNADDWTDAADKVAKGQAAMTLMGTWITGYWNQNGLKPGEDYDVFEFPTVDPSVPNAVVGPVDGFVMSGSSKNVAGAEKLLSLIVADVDLQSNWAKTQGALSPNVKVPGSIYTPVMKKAQEAVAAAPNFAFNYDLATPPPVAEVGLNMFAKFMGGGSSIDSLLDETQKGAADAFKK